jgi:hypothetical protein
LCTDDTAAILADIAKTFMYFAELKRHPVVQWATAENLELDLLEIAQHYGIATPLIDLSESIEVALFFATHDYMEGRGFEPRTEGRGVLYIVDREKLPLEYARRFNSVAIQPFARPFRQWAWSCELLMGECFEACPCLAVLEFEHSAVLAQEVRERAAAQGDLFPGDLLADLGAVVGALRVLPRSAVTAALKHLGPAYPAHLVGPAEGILRNAGFCISQRFVPVYSESFWAQTEPRLRQSLDAWRSAIAGGNEQLVVRKNRRGGEPVEWARYNGPSVTPTPIERLKRVDYESAISLDC